MNKCNAVLHGTDVFQEIRHMKNELSCGHTIILPQTSYTDELYSL